MDDRTVPLLTTEKVDAIAQSFNAVEPEDVEPTLEVIERVLSDASEAGMVLGDDARSCFALIVRLLLARASDREVTRREVVESVLACH